MPVARSEQEIDEVMNQAADSMDTGSQWPGMTYEQGVYNALQWATGLSDENPMAE